MLTRGISPKLARYREMWQMLRNGIFGDENVHRKRSGDGHFGGGCAGVISRRRVLLCAACSMTFQGIDRVLQHRIASLTQVALRSGYSDIRYDALRIGAWLRSNEKLCREAKI